MPDRKPLTQHGFLELPVTRDLSEGRVDVAILGVPYDLSTTGRSGSREGPLGVRRASWHMSWEPRRWPWRFALGDRLGVIDYGDVIFDTGNNQQMVDVLQQDARTLLAAGKTILSLGGDHYISLPLLREHFKAYGPISLVHFDAHTDNEPIEGSFNHGSMFREALQEGLLDPARSVQIGIRTEYDYDNHPFTVLDAAWVNLHSAQETGGGDPPHHWRYTHVSHVRYRLPRPGICAGDRNARPGGDLDGARARDPQRTRGMQFDRNGRGRSGTRLRSRRARSSCSSDDRTRVALHQSRYTRGSGCGAWDRQPLGKSRRSLFPKSNRIVRPISIKSATYLLGIHVNCRIRITPAR